MPSETQWAYQVDHWRERALRAERDLAESVVDDRDSDAETPEFWRERYAQLAQRLRCDELSPQGDYFCDREPGHTGRHANWQSAEWS